MSFYIRKSLKAGPLRFNISKSGVGVSAGIPGLRVGRGPRGNYVHMGRNGLYYRATLPYSGKPNPSPTGDQQISSTIMEEIESLDTLLLQDSSSESLLEEIRNKQSKPQLWKVALGIAVITFVVLWSVNVQTWVFIPVALVFILIVFFAYRYDQIAKTTILFYELEPDAEKAFQMLHDAFGVLASCSKKWHVFSSGRVTDTNEWKRQAGASTLVRRNTTQLVLKSPPYVSTNLAIPCVAVGKQKLYFFPDKLFVYEGGKVGVVSFGDLQIEHRNTRFIESDGVPSDARVVGQTWQYVNKSGGPDKRYKNNRQIPIAQYSEVLFKSSTGLNELIQLSKPDLGSEITKALSTMISSSPDQLKL